MTKSIQRFIALVLIPALLFEIAAPQAAASYTPSIHQVVSSFSSSFEEQALTPGVPEFLRSFVPKRTASIDLLGSTILGAAAAGMFYANWHYLINPRFQKVLTDPGLLLLPTLYTISLACAGLLAWKIYTWIIQPLPTLPHEPVFLEDSASVTDTLSPALAEILQTVKNHPVDEQLLRALYEPLARITSAKVYEMQTINRLLFSGRGPRAREPMVQLLALLIKKQPNLDAFVVNLKFLSPDVYDEIEMALADMEPPPYPNNHLPGLGYRLRLIVAARRGSLRSGRHAEAIFQAAKTVIDSEPALAELRGKRVILNRDAIDAYAWLIWLANRNWKKEAEGQLDSFETIHSHLIDDSLIHDWVEFKLLRTSYDPDERHLIAQWIDDALVKNEPFVPRHQDLDDKDKHRAKGLFRKLLHDFGVPEGIRRAIQKTFEKRTHGFSTSQQEWRYTNSAHARLLRSEYLRLLFPIVHQNFTTEHIAHVANMDPSTIQRLMNPEKIRLIESQIVDDLMSTLTILRARTAPSAADVRGALRHLIDVNHWSITDISKFTGISPTTISHILVEDVGSANTRRQLWNAIKQAPERPPKIQYVTPPRADLMAAEDIQITLPPLMYQRGITLRDIELLTGINLLEIKEVIHEGRGRPNTVQTLREGIAELQAAPLRIERTLLDIQNLLVSVDHHRIETIIHSREGITEARLDSIRAWRYGTPRPNINQGTLNRLKAFLEQPSTAEPIRRQWIISWLPPILIWARQRYYGETRWEAKRWADQNLVQVEEQIFRQEIYNRTPTLLTRTLRLMILAAACLSVDILSTLCIVSAGLGAFYVLQRFRDLAANITQAFLFATSHIGNHDWATGWISRFTAALILQALWNQGDSELAIQTHQINNDIYDFWGNPEAMQGDPVAAGNRLLAWDRNPLLGSLEHDLGRHRWGPFLVEDPDEFSTGKLRSDVPDEAWAMLQELSNHFATIAEKLFEINTAKAPTIKYLRVSLRKVIRDMKILSRAIMARSAKDQGSKSYLVTKEDLWAGMSNWIGQNFATPLLSKVATADSQWLVEEARRLQLRTDEAFLFARRALIRISQMSKRELVPVHKMKSTILGINIGRFGAEVGWTPRVKRSA